MHEWILVGDLNLVAMSTNTMWQFLHWPSHILYESMASCDEQSVCNLIRTNCGRGTHKVKLKPHVRNSNMI